MPVRMQIPPAMWTIIVADRGALREDRFPAMTVDRSPPTTKVRVSQYDRVFQSALTTDRRRVYAPPIPTGTAPRPRSHASIYCTPTLIFSRKPDSVLVPS